MFEALRTEIESLDVPVDADALVELLAVRDALEARVSAAVGDFDRSGLYELEGRATMTEWLKRHARMTAAEAYRLVHTARRLRPLPATARAWAAGELSGGQVATVLASVRAEHRELYAEQEAELTPKLGALDIDQTRRALGHWSAKAEAVIDPAWRHQPQRSLRASRLLGDRVVLEGELDADGGEVVLTALRVAETTDDPGTDRSPGTRRADALVDIARFFLDNQTTASGGRHRPHLNVVIGAEDFYEARRASYIGGTALEASTIAQLLCDSTFHRCVIDADGAVLDFGRATRTVSAPLWSALVVRDEHCRFAGCDRPARWGEAHHVVWFSRGGRTSLDNLVLLCSRHHHLLHKGGWEAKLRPDAVFEVTDPWGNVHTTSPPRAARLE
jgi:hypothetical protein